jgi:hypothetical protein
MDAVTMSGMARVAAACVAIVAAALAAGCASQGSGAAAAPATVQAGHSAAQADHAAVVVDEHANNTTVQVVAGVEVVLELHSTYWMNVASSQPAVLRQDGEPRVQATQCVPGGGCGQVQAAFSAVAVGTAVLSASRVSCGEALARARRQPLQRHRRRRGALTAPALGRRPPGTSPASRSVDQVWL